MIFRNGRLIFPDAIRDGLELVVRDGKITEIRESSRVSESDVIDLHGNFLAPGFIDLHLHGGVGRDTMEASSEAFRAICDHHATGGTTSLLLTTVTAPMDEIVSVLQTVKELHPMKQILGVHVEGPFISKAKRGAQREEFITEPTSELIGEL
ncbi:MAG: amidohydrolase family protein, partial [Verrucomicrobiota bacterium]|nr:amidohydrolase family protein [Verrucomicrobiota bacterium]